MGSFTDWLKDLLHSVVQASNVIHIQITKSKAITFSILHFASSFKSILSVELFSLNNVMKNQTNIWNMTVMCVVYRNAKQNVSHSVVEIYIFIFSVFFSLLLEYIEKNWNCACWLCFCFYWGLESVHSIQIHDNINSAYVDNATAFKIY